MFGRGWLSERRRSWTGKVLDKANLEGHVPGIYSLSAGSQLDSFCPDEADGISKSGGVLCLLERRVTQTLLINDTPDHV